MTVPVGFDRVDAPNPELIAACVHCGFCLPTCPTYAVMGEEMDSPRGRIYLMQAAHEGRTPIDESFVRHFDRCLGCLACVTACPSGVQYGPLVEATRAQIERRYARPAADRRFRRAIFALFPHPARLRVALLPLVPYRWLEPVAARLGALALLPARLRAMLALAPPISLRSLFHRTPVNTPAVGARRLTVGMLTGCVQRFVFPGVNDATVRVLTAEGCEVRAPKAQTCCGALSAHSGRLDEARDAARRTIACFEAAGVDRVVANAAGCGSAMKEYGHLLAGDTAWAERARAFSARVRDVMELVAELPAQARRHPLPLRVVYQDACHLAHGQGVRTQPRRLLAGIPALTLLESAETELCCGSAGIYNLLEPDTARELGGRKLAALTEARPDVIASGNPGCMLQLAAAGRAQGEQWSIRHPVELLDASIRGKGLDETD